MNWVVHQAEGVVERAEWSAAFANDGLLSLMALAANHQERRQGRAAAAGGRTLQTPHPGDDRAGRRPGPASQRFAVQPDSALHAAGQANGPGYPMIVGSRME